MIGKVQKEVKYHLTINQDELNYLMAIMQNYTGRREDEPASESEIRCELFNGLSNINENSYHKQKSQEAIGEDIADYTDGSNNDIEVEIMDDVKVIVSPTTIEEDEDSLYD